MLIFEVQSLVAMVCVILHLVVLLITETSLCPQIKAGVLHQEPSVSTELALYRVIYILEETK